MIELLFVACISASPSHCEERSMMFTDLTSMTCMMRAQPQLAEWIETHPKWRIASWKCQVPTEGRDA